MVLLFSLARVAGLEAVGEDLYVGGGPGVRRRGGPVRCSVGDVGNRAGIDVVLVHRICRGADDLLTRVQEAVVIAARVDVGAGLVAGQVVVDRHWAYQPQVAGVLHHEAVVDDIVHRSEGVAGGGDCVNNGIIATNVGNLIEDNTCSPLLSGDPNLDVLADNGGPTQTHALLESSSTLSLINAAVVR